MPFPQKPDWAKLEVETLHVQGQVHLIAGAGGNIAVQVGDDGVLLVDTGYEQMSGKVLAAHPQAVEQDAAHDHQHDADGLPHRRQRRAHQGRPPQSGRARASAQRPNEADLIGHSQLLALMTEDRPRQDCRRALAAQRLQRQVRRICTRTTSRSSSCTCRTRVTAGDSMVWFRKSDVVVAGRDLQPGQLSRTSMSRTAARSTASSTG